MAPRKCPTCNGPVPKGQKYCRLACVWMGRSIKAKERRIKELEDRIALLVQTPGGPLHCLTCGKQSRDRWCGELCREKWITAASVGAEWVWIVAEAIFRAEESRK